MNLSDFNYYNNLKNRLAKLDDEKETAKKAYFDKMTNLTQLENDYDVDTIDQLVSVLNNGDDDQTAVDIKNALTAPDKNYLLQHAAQLDNTKYVKLKTLVQEERGVEQELNDITAFYQRFVIPHIDKIKANKGIHTLEVNPGNNGSDTTMRFDFLSTFDDFKEVFKDAQYVDEIVKKHIEQQTPISLILTKDNYPNAYDVSLVEDQEN